MEVWKILDKFEHVLLEKAQVVEKALDFYLPKEDIFPETIHEAMHYSTSAGGKRLRPIIVLESAKLFGQPQEKVMPTACAIEMIHTYSLIHDDLPVMDNDDFRRGKPTCHKVFGEGVALLAGDALLTHAFNTIARNALIPGINPTAVIDVIQEVSLAAGSQGMVGGQTMDVISAGSKIDEETLFYISNHKTGCLISTSLWAGARLCDVSDSDLERVKTYGEKIGLIFQIMDDILDVKGDEKLLGKPTGSDIKNDKNTFPNIYGYENSIKLLDELADDAKKLISYYDRSEFFIKLTDFFLARKF